MKEYFSSTVYELKLFSVRTSTLQETLNEYPELGWITFRVDFLKRYATALTS